MAIASGDSVGLAPFSPLAAALSGNMRKVVFIMICAMRGEFMIARPPSYCRNAARVACKDADSAHEAASLWLIRLSHAKLNSVISKNRILL